jgi:hypothetical protein
MAKGNFPAGTRVIAPNNHTGGLASGIIIDNLSVMYYIHFDCGRYDFVYKAQQVTLEK